jgi:hypothetical protein
MTFKAKETPEFLPVVQDPSLPHAIICDIDGTLAHMNGRSPYDYSKVGEDTVDETILSLLKIFSDQYHIVFVSGRPDRCKTETFVWILKHFNSQWIELYMRKEWDKRNDTIVKREILDELIKEYYIEFVLDDRDRVVKMFRESWIKVLQVADGNF